LASKGPYAIYCFLRNKSDSVNDKEIERYVDIKGSKAHFIRHQVGINTDLVQLKKAIQTITGLFKNSLFQ
jgi:hypothetical protein